MLWGRNLENKLQNLYRSCNILRKTFAESDGGEKKGSSLSALTCRKNQFLIDMLPFSCDITPFSLKILISPPSRAPESGSSHVSVHLTSAVVSPPVQRRSDSRAFQASSTHCCRCLTFLFLSTLRTSLSTAASSEVWPQNLLSCCSDWKLISWSDLTAAFSSIWNTISEICDLFMISWRSESVLSWCWLMNHLTVISGER